MALGDTNGHTSNVIPFSNHIEGLKVAKNESKGELRPANPRPEDKAETDGRPMIDVKKPLEHVVDRSVEVLAKDPTIFNMHSELTHVLDEGDRIRTRPIKASQARYLLAQGAKWVSGPNKVHPPTDIATCVVDRTAWKGIRVLRAVTPFPAMDPEGRLRMEPGYDEHTKTYFTGRVKVDVPESPTQEDAVKAVEALLDIVQDFPFARAETREHAAAFIGGLLTPLARYAHEGNAPLTVVQANCARAGKTTLVQVISRIVTGFDSSVVTFTKNEDETRKRIFTFLRHPRSIVLVDNVVGQFGGANINAMLTTRSFEDRIIGQSKYLEVKADASWFVTGNNMTLAPDTAERCLHVRLQSDEENPHERTGLKYPYLFETVKDRRGELLSAALTILKAYILAGKPEAEPKLSPWGGFETWSRLVQGAVVFAGLPDPTLTRTELEEEADVEGDSMGSVVKSLWTWQQEANFVRPYEGSDVLESLTAEPNRYAELRTALANLAATPGGALPSAKVVGRHFREAKNRNFGGFILRSEKRHSANLYWVELVGPAPAVRRLDPPTDPEPGG